MGRAKFSVTLASVMLVSLVATGALAGCAQDPDQAQVIPANEVQKSDQGAAGMTALQRGQVRHVALTAAKKGWAAWERNDVNGMAPYFDKSYVDYYRKLYAKYDKQGKRRVRKFDITTFDVIDMNSQGTEVLVSVEMQDFSYYAKSGRPISKPTKALTSAQLAVDKQKDGSWHIVRMIMGKNLLE